MNPALHSLILTIRDQKVILDADLAAIYGVKTKRLNEQVKRNVDRFLEDFMFQLNSGEWRNLKSQIATSSLEYSEDQSDTQNRPQIVTSSQKHRGTFSYAFTEHDALMQAAISSPNELAHPRLLDNIEFINRYAGRPAHKLARTLERGCGLVFSRS